MKMNDKRLDTFIEAYKSSNDDAIKIQSASMNGDILTSFCTLQDDPDYIYRLECNVLTKEGNLTLYKIAGFTELTVHPRDN